MAWFLYILLKCIQLLAWPAFALAYPLCASIQAVETNSIHHIRRLVTYWILFSMISLFEQTFNNLLQWVPVWSYAKILVIFWLIIPGFYGSTIAYNSIVRPRFYMQLLQEAMDILYKKQDTIISLQKVSFLAVAERFVYEHGAEALEKPISIKQPEIKELTCARTDIKPVETQNESAGDLKNKPLDFKNVQKEWTCAVCQVTTNSETSLNSHLRGLRHKTKCEELKARKQPATKKDAVVGVRYIYRKCTICEVTTQSFSSWKSHLQGKKHKAKCEDLGFIVCGICNVTCSSEFDMASHLRGRRHIEGLFAVKSTV